MLITTPLSLIYAVSLLFGFGLLLYFAIKIRDSIANLPDSKLSDFMVNSVFKGGILIGLSQVR